MVCVYVLCVSVSVCVRERERACIVYVCVCVCVICLCLSLCVCLLQCLAVTYDAFKLWYRARTHNRDITICYIISLLLAERF